MKVGDRVKVVSYNPAYYWKRDLVGKLGVVDEVSGEAVAVRLEDGASGFAPVWLGRDCLKIER